MKNLMEMVNMHGITLLNIKPKPRVEKPKYIAAPYEEMRCTYEQLGKFVDLEKSPRKYYR